MGFMRVSLILIVAFFCLTGCEDKSPPTWCSDCELTAKATSGSEVSLSWGKAEDDREVESYQVLVDDVEHMTVHGAQNKIAIDALTEPKSYRFSVVALDKAGNSSEPLHAEARTLDKVGPVWNTGTIRFSKHVDGVMAAWPEATDPAGVSEYKLITSEGEQSLGSKRMQKVSEEMAKAGVSVVAIDSVGNRSTALKATFGVALPELAVAAEVQQPIGAAPTTTNPNGVQVTPEIQGQLRQPLSPRVIEMLSKRQLANPKLKGLIEMPNVKLNIPKQGLPQ